MMCSLALEGTLYYIMQLVLCPDLWFGLNLDAVSCRNHLNAMRGLLCLKINLNLLHTSDEADLS